MPSEYHLDQGLIARHFNRGVFERNRKRLLHPVYFRMFLVKNLPLAFLTGMRITSIDAEHCAVALRYQWMNRNPFKSMFWAAMGMAAEMATGALLFVYTHQQSPKIRFILTEVHAEFAIKAKGLMSFVCRDGASVVKNILEIRPGPERRSVQLPVTCYDPSGQVNAEFLFTWVLQSCP